MKSKAIILIIVLLLAVQVKAEWLAKSQPMLYEQPTSNAFLQQISKPFIRIADTNYVTDLTSTFIIRGLNSFKTCGFNIEDKQSLLALRYRSDTIASIGAGINYKWLSFGLQLSTGRRAKHVIGRQNHINIQILQPTFNIKTDISEYNGLFVYNKDSIICGLPRNDYYIRNDLKYIKLRIQADYVINHNKYSAAAATGLNTIQKKTVGSFLLGAEWEANIIMSDSSLVPSNVNDSLFAYKSNINGISNITFGVTTGYAMNVVLPKGFFVHGTYVVGVGTDRKTIRDQTADDLRYRSLASMFRAEIATGYNCRRFYAGAWINYSVNRSKIGSTAANIYTESLAIRIVFAYRIFLKKDYPLNIGGMRDMVNDLRQRNWN